MNERCDVPRLQKRIKPVVYGMAGQQHVHDIQLFLSVRPVVMWICVSRCM